MQTAPESHVPTAVCGDFELLHAANYSYSYALMLCVYEEQMDNGFDSLTVTRYCASKRSGQGACPRRQKLWEVSII